ncbi:MAG: hypothetical protein J5732_05150 [Bacteroidaceae bacterium]|nr:hypothetical protein [Bacteroidaceae bacterium]
MDANGKRETRMVCLLNDKERDFIDDYLSKYKISNRSRWMRETLLSFIYQKLGTDYPTLFDEQDMRR